MDIKEFLDCLKKNHALHENNKINQEKIESIEPKYFSGNFSEIMSEEMATALKSRINKLYSHQANAIKASKNNNVILESPTASGKTLAFTVSMIENIKNGSTALMVYPMKAVAHDQQRQIQEICSSLNITCKVFDGSLSNEEKQKIWNNPPSILLTNPEYLHSSFLWHANKHEKFLSKLSFLVLDEAHEYRGYFGSHVSLIIRRFLAKMKKDNEMPKIFMATATCETPKDHAETLTGCKFELISARDALRPPRNFIFVDHNIPDYEFWKIFPRSIANSAITCLEQNLNVLIFSPSVKFAEDTCITTRKKANEKGLDENKISVFHAGLGDEEKQDRQHKMQNGSLPIIFCTNALELGIDVGKLDGVILAGFPDSVAAARQRIGRAGRAWNKDAFVLYYPVNNPWDRYFVENLNDFINNPLDPILLDPQNEEAIKRHISCLLSEIGSDMDSSFKELLGEKFFKEATKMGSPRDTQKNYKWLLYNMRGGKYGFKLKVDNREIGTISGARRFREAYQDAILTQAGETYKVESIEEGVVYLRREENKNIKTIPHIDTKIDIGETDILDEKSCDFGKIEFRPINIGQRITGYKLINNETDDENNWKAISESDSEYHKIFDNDRYAFIMKFSNLEKYKTNITAIRTLEHIMRVGVVAIPAEKHDISTYFDSGTATLYLYENYPGGIGIARQIFGEWGKIMKKGIKIAKDCKCERKKGCARCIMSPFEDSEINKQNGIELAQKILEKNAK